MVEMPRLQNHKEMDVAFQPLEDFIQQKFLRSERIKDDLPNLVLREYDNVFEEIGECAPERRDSFLIPAGHF